MLSRRLPVLLLLLPLCGQTGAATLCATDGASLKAALAIADSNGQADVIRMARGTYAYPGSGTFSYTPPASENFDLEISGGWFRTISNACGFLAADTTPFDTVIATGSPTRLMNIEPPAGSSGDVTVRRIAFLGGDAGSGEGGGLRIYPLVGYAGTILVDQSAFLDNQADEGAALRIASAGPIYLRNSLFFENNATGNAAVAIETFSGPGFHVTNTTIVDNTTDSTGTGIFSGLKARVGGGSAMFIANNNLWGNEGFNLRLEGTGSKYVRNNNVTSISQLGNPGVFENNISVEPIYESGSLNFTPEQGSALINAGTRPPDIVPPKVPFEDDWATGTLDIYSNPRVSGAQIDIGAYEADDDRIFANGFD